MEGAGIRRADHTLYVDAGRDDALRWFPEGGTLAEVGVFKGGFSRRIVEIAKPKRLHVINQWKWTRYDWNKPPAAELRSYEHYRGG